MSASDGKVTTISVSRRGTSTGPGERRRSLALARGRTDLATLGRGDPDLPSPPPHIVESAKRALDGGATHFAHWRGRADLREAVAEKCWRDYSPAVHPDQAIVTVGAQEAVYVTFQALLDPGDEVFLCDPHYTSYSAAIRLAGGLPVSVPVTETRGFVIDPDALEARISPRTEAMVAVTPDNPTGVVIPSETIVALAEVGRRRNLLVIADDIYERFVYEGPLHVSIAATPRLDERTIMINGFSKTYAMTGWRLGYMVVLRPLVPAIEVIKRTLTICVPAVSQAAGLAALAGPQDCVAAMRRVYAERRAHLIERLEAWKMGDRRSRGALYVFARIVSTGLPAYEFCIRMMDEVGVRIFPGTAYGGGEGYVRASFLQLAEILRVALDRMEPVVRALRGR